MRRLWTWDHVALSQFRWHWHSRTKRDCLWRSELPRWSWLCLRSFHCWSFHTLRWALASDSTAEWYPFTFQHSTMQVTWSAWGMTPSWFLPILRNDVIWCQISSPVTVPESEFDVLMILLTMTFGSPEIAWGKVHRKNKSALSRIDFCCSSCLLNFVISTVKSLTSSSFFWPEFWLHKPLFSWGSRQDLTRHPWTSRLPEWCRLKRLWPWTMAWAFDSQCPLRMPWLLQTIPCRMAWLHRMK